MADLAPVTVEGSAPAQAPAAPEPTPQAPALVQPSAGKVAIHDEDGSISLVAEKDLAAAMAEGARPATMPEYMGAKTGLAGQAASAAIGLGRGATLGLSDPAAIELSRLIGGDAEAEDTRRALNLSRAVNPKTEFAGEMVGSLAPLMFGAPPVGAGVAEGSALARAGARIVQHAPGLAAWGGAMGAGQELSESALGNHDLNGQRLAMSVAGGAVLNLILGGGLVAGGGAAADFIGSRLARPLTAAESEITRGLTAYRSADVEALAAREFGATERGLGDVLREKLVKGAAAASGKDVEALDLLSRDLFKGAGAPGVEARRIGFYEGEKKMHATIRSLRTDGDVFVRELPDAMNEFKGAMKAEKVAQLVSRGNEEQVTLFARKRIANVIDAMENELTHLDGVTPATIKDIEAVSRTAYHADAQLAEAVAKGKDINTEAFMALDGLKRQVQMVADGAAERAGAHLSAIDKANALRSTRTMMGLEGELRTGLENTELWGKAGSVQADMNAAWSQHIDARKRFDAALVTNIGRNPADPLGAPLKGIDPGKLETYANGVLNPNKDLTHQSVRDTVASAERLARTFRENVALPPERVAQLERIEKSARSFGASVKSAEKTLTIVNQAKHLMGAQKDTATIAGALGFIGGGPVGGLLGAAVGSVTNPGKTLAQMAAIERTGAKVSDRFKGASGDFFGGGAKKLAAKAEPKVTEEQIRQIRAIVTNPSALQARIASAIAPIQNIAPRTSVAMAATVTRMAEYLAKNLPKEPEPKTLTFDQRPQKMSAVDLAKARDVIKAVDGLDAILRGVSSHKLNRQYVTALQQVAPELYEDLKKQLRDDAEKLKPKLSFQQQVTFSVLFNEPLHAIMKPETIRSFQKSFAQGAGPEQGQSGGQSSPPKRPLALSGALRSGTDALEAPDGWT